MAETIISRANALAQGLKRFYTGIPCKHGHLSERRTADGNCVECDRLKSARQRKDNPEKARECWRRYHQRNRDKRSEANRQWRAKNRERVRALKKAARLRNPELYREMARRWRERHPDRSKAQGRESYARHKVKIRAKVNRRYQEDPEFRSKHIDEARNRTALKRGAEGRFTTEDARSLLVGQKHRCAYCRCSLKRARRHLDHIIPLALGGTNWPDNLQWLCAPCNLSKGAKDPVQFAQERGLLL